MSDPEGRDSKIRGLPQSRVRPPGGTRPFRELGMGELARRLAMPPDRTDGHWCSRCRGIWYGYFLEATCRACGSRQG